MVERQRRAAGRGSCRRTATSPSSGNTSGLSVTASSSRSSAPVDVGQRVARPRRAPAARSAACRGPARGRSRRGWRRPREPASSARSRAATRCAPGLRRTRVQARVERDGRALERLQRQRHRDDRRRRAAAPRVAHRQPAGRRHQVRAVDQREPLLGLRARPARGRPAPAPPRPPGARRRPPPRPRRPARARGGRAARGRPLEPTEPLARHDRARRRARASPAAARRPPRARPSARAAATPPAARIIPRTTSLGQRPARRRPRASARRLSCSCAASSAPMRTLARFPKPVVTP